MIIHDASDYLNDEPLGEFMFFPEISSNPDFECNLSIRTKDIEAFQVERRYFNPQTGALVDDSTKRPVFMLFAITKERKYCVTSFYTSNREPNLLHAVVTESLERRKKINWEELREVIELYAKLEGRN